jgi:hypothetical protein
MTQPESSSLIRARIKAATRAQVAACGGVTAAGTMAGLSKSMLSLACGDDYKEMISLTAALMLEAQSGQPVFAGLFAEMTGHELTVAAESAATPVPNMIGHLTAIFAEAADATKTIAKALEDGAVSPAEATASLKEIADLERVLTAAKRALVKIKGSR